MNYSELLQKLNSYVFKGALVVIYRKSDRFANSTLYAKGLDIMSLSSNVVNAVTTKGTKGIFQIVEL